MKTLTVQIWGEGNVLPPGGVFEDNSAVALLATPAPGWVFFKWANTDGDGANPTSVHMGDNKIVVAYFIPKVEFDPKPLLVGAAIVGVIFILSKMPKTLPRLAYERNR